MVPLFSFKLCLKRAYKLLGILSELFIVSWNCSLNFFMSSLTFLSMTFA